MKCQKEEKQETEMTDEKHERGKNINNRVKNLGDGRKTK